MEDLTNVYLSPLPDSPYVKPFRFNYTQNGMEKTWDLLEVHDSVAIIVFNISRNVMVFVKQFRPAIYYNRVLPQDRLQKLIDTTKYPAALGIALEMCAGIIDKDKPVEEIAKEEVLEECGYDVPLEKLQRITSYRWRRRRRNNRGGGEIDSGSGGDGELHRPHPQSAQLSVRADVVPAL
ncbi:uridine diphosphate glucose pyrophosphatase NUDT14-like isoform X2 [Maniola hyperantus]|uniref:uridine diphosphate glucose pyrophosphatase NUDT14-like isoform X2 n=1 Tax=Aphantopus hyperantus TaxID=2795564 RepID=UPI002136C7C4